ncbi:hypothetical protein GCM10025771_17510 [Niveibacterium umoris]
MCEQRRGVRRKAPDRERRAALFAYFLVLLPESKTPAGAGPGLTGQTDATQHGQSKAEALGSSTFSPIGTVATTRKGARSKAPNPNRRAIRRCPHPKSATERITKAAYSPPYLSAGDWA